MRARISGRAVSEGTGQHQPPAGFEGFERFHQARDVLTLLDGADVQDDLFAGGRGIGKLADTVVDHADFRGFHAEQRDHRVPGERGNRDDGVRALGGVAGLGGEAGAEFRGGVLAGQHEQIVECGDGAPQGDARQALIQAMEEIGGARTERLGEQAPPGIGRERIGPGRQ